MTQSLELQEGSHRPTTCGVNSVLLVSRHTDSILLKRDETTWLRLNNFLVYQVSRLACHLVVKYDSCLCACSAARTILKLINLL